MTQQHKKEVEKSKGKAEDELRKSLHGLLNYYTEKGFVSEEEAKRLRNERNLRKAKEELKRIVEARLEEKREEQLAALRKKRGDLDVGSV